MVGLGKLVEVVKEGEKGGKRARMERKGGDEADRRAVIAGILNKYRRMDALSDDELVHSGSRPISEMSLLFSSRSQTSAAALLRDRCCSLFQHQRMMMRMKKKRLPALICPSSMKEGRLGVCGQQQPFWM